MTDPDCDRLHDVGPELALGLLDAEQRAAALAHLDRCPDCRARITDYTRVGDGLLALLPGAEPPVGFEDRVLARLHHTAQPAAATAPPGFPAPPSRFAARTVVPRPRRRWVPLAAAAVVVALVFGFGGWAVGRHGASPAQVTAGGLEHGTLLTAAHHSAGEVWLYTGEQPWLYMYVNTSPGTPRISCQLKRKDGGIVDVGSFPLANGFGYWGAPTDVDPGQLAGARIVDDHGSVLANASFP